MSIEQVLLQSEAFRGLHADEIADLASAMTEKRFRAGSALVVEGAQDRDLYVILSGEVAVTRTPVARGAATRLGTLGAGDLLGLVSLLDPGPRSSTCTAVTDVVAAVLPLTAFTLLYHSSSGFSARFRYVVAQQVARDLQRLTDTLHAPA